MEWPDGIGGAYSEPKTKKKAKKLDAVFEGGGVKGIGHVGAVSVVEGKGYQFENLAGVSAGAIVAALLAAGYSAAELKGVMDDLDYNNFKDAGFLGGIPALGPVGRLLFSDGIYKGDWFETWMADLLAYKGVVTFKDLVMPEHFGDMRYRYKLQVVAADISKGKMLVLPEDITGYGIKPDNLHVARAVRMSMSIPFFFKPVKIKWQGGQASYIVDGGVLSNFPVWLFDDGSPNPPWPTLGFKLVSPKDGKPHKIKGPISMFTALFNTMLDAHDARHVATSDFVRTIAIPTLDVGTVDFDITKEKSEALFQSGVDAATDFFKTWTFAKYKTQRKKSING